MVTRQQHKEVSHVSMASADDRREVGGTVSSSSRLSEAEVRAYLLNMREHGAALPLQRVRRTSADRLYRSGSTLSRADAGAIGELIGASRRSHASISSGSSLPAARARKGVRDGPNGPQVRRIQASANRLKPTLLHQRQR